MFTNRDVLYKCHCLLQKDKVYSVFRASPIDAEAMSPGADSNLELWVKIETDSFIALPSKGRHSGLVPQKTVCPSLVGVIW